MRIVTAKQMKQIEQDALQYALSEQLLMEHAGMAATAAIRRDRAVEGRRVTIFCGSGNNGGDGFVVARGLCEAGAQVTVLLTDGPPRTAQAAAMLAQLAPMQVDICPDVEDAQLLTDLLAATDILVDAVYGAGFHGALDERHRALFARLNATDLPICALDLPSGVIADTGAADPDAVRAGLTVVFDSLKAATCMPKAQTCCGRVVLADIGIPAQVHDAYPCAYTLVDAAHVFAQLPPRPRQSHKGSFGRLLNIAGSRRYMGAAALSTLAAMRSGAGYVTLASTGEVCRTVLPMLPEAVMLPLPETPQGSLSLQAQEELLTQVAQSDAVMLGSGLGRTDEVRALVEAVLKTARCPVILDADGINAVASNITILKEAACARILTPHLGELSRLTGEPLTRLAHDPIPAGQRLARELQATVVLKDAYTHTVTPDGHIYINTTGNAGLAKAGSGDLLAGIIGALAAQGRSSEEAAACGVWLHGRAADLAAAQHSQYGMLPRDVIEQLGTVFCAHGR